MQGLDWQTVQLPLAAGINQKMDSRALQPPELTRAVDVQFEELGGLQTRKPFGVSAGALAIVGGGSINVADVRRFCQNGDELLLFTKDSVYSRNIQLSAWVLKGTHLAVKVDEQPRFVTTGDQLDCDRAELNGTILFSWTELVGATSLGYVAAIDKASGSVLMAPTKLPGSAGRLRLTALTTKILLSFYDGIGGLYAYALDPASPATALGGASTTLTNTNFGTFYDITRVAGADQALFASRRAPATSYLIGTVTAGLVVATSTKARTCDGAIAVSCSPTGTQVQVVRTVDDGTGLGTLIKGDLVTISTLTDVNTNTAIATETAGPTALLQLTAAHRSVQNGGAYRAYVFWDIREDSGPPDWWCKSNWIDTSNNVGTAAVFVRRLGVASRAFDYNGNVYVWGVFAQASGVGYRSARSQLQNSFFLYRDDGFLCAKAASTRAGGFAYSQSMLPSVQLTSGTSVFSWCGTDRRIIELGSVDSTGYADRGPRDITFTFDSNEARRCVRLGESLYVTGGELLQYDGRQLVEVGFHMYPWNFQFGSVGAGNVEDGTYAWKVTWRYDNARGELDRSTTATTATDTVAAGPDKLEVTQWANLHITHKTTPAIAVEVWRTLKNPTEDAPYYLATSKDPANTTNPNRYVSNDPTANWLPTFDDNFADSDLQNLESNPENGGVLENIAPPAATIIAASDVRLFLAGVAGDPDRVWYSKQRNSGEVASFHDALTVDIPPRGGLITALAVTSDGIPVVFRETATYVLLNDGYDNGSGGQNYVAREVSPEVGAVSHESVGVTEAGVVFHSAKGKYLLNRALSPTYIGDKVSSYDSETPLAVDVVPSQHQVRFLTSSRMLVLDTVANQWAEWSIADGVHACVWRGVHVYLSSASGLKEQRTDFTGVDYGMDVETAWIKVNDLQGVGRIRKLLALGEYRSTFKLRCGSRATTRRPTSKTRRGRRRRQRSAVRFR
jgi:hypothetical protein